MTNTAPMVQSHQRPYSKSTRPHATTQLYLESTRRLPNGSYRPTAPKSFIRLVQPAFQNQPCFHIAILRCRTFAWPEGVDCLIFSECWSTSPHRTLVARAKN